MKRHLPYCVLLFFLLTASFACVNNMEEVSALSSDKDTKIEIARHIETYYYGTDGMLKGIMTAPVLYRYMTDTPYIKLNEGLKVKFYKDSLQLESILTARKGMYYENSDVIEVSDSVVVTTRDNKKLETDILHWDPKKQQFYTDQPVKLTTPTQVIYGKNGLIAPPNLSWYQFNKASGDIKVDSSFSKKP